MIETNSQVKVLHIWDTRVDSGLNIDDLLQETPLLQKSVSRILVHQGARKAIPQVDQHHLEEILSPFPKNVFMRQLSHLKFRKLVRREISQFNPNVLFFHFGQTAAKFIDLAVKYRKPFVVALYGHDISVAINQPRWQKKYRTFSKSDGRFLVLANDVKQRVINLGVDESRITLYSYPLNIHPYLNIKKRLHEGRFTITIPGRLVEKKGHIFLFNAIQILKERNIIVDLIVIGYGGNREHFQKAASDIGVSEQIQWIDSTEATIQGKFDQLYSRVLEETDLVVLPCITSSEGDNEAGPALVLCLAQASGTPVLTTPFRGHEISITDGITGLLSTEGDSADLADKIAWCLEHPIQVSKISEAGKLHVQEVFNQEASTRAIYEIIAQESLRNK